MEHLKIDHSWQSHKTQHNLDLRIQSSYDKKTADIMILEL